MPNLRSPLTILLLATASFTFAEDITGTVVDAAGKPIPNVKIRSSAYVLADDHRTLKQYIPLKATSDRQGAFKLTNAPAAPSENTPVEIIALLPNGHITTGKLTQNSGKLVLKDAQTTCQVHTEDANGKPLAGATVVIGHFLTTRDGKMPTDRSVIYVGAWPDADLEFTQKTDAKGTATFSNVPVGCTAMIKASKDFLTSSEAEATLTSEAPNSTSLKLAGQASVLSGRVVHDGKPIKGVLVTAQTSQGRRATAKTDADGFYRIPDAIPGITRLSVELGDLSKKWAAKGYSGIYVKPGSELNGLNFAVDDGVLFTGSVLTTGSNKPVPQAHVSVYQEDGQSKEILTGADGQFAVRVSEGDISVNVWQVGARRLERGIQLSATVDAAHNPPVEMRIAEAFILPPVKDFSGTVLDSQGKPVAGATVSNLANTVRTVTDAQGNFQIKGDTAPGTKFIALVGNQISTHPAEVLQNPTANLTIDGKTSAAEGIAIDQDGKPLAGVELTLSAIDGATMTSKSTVTTGSDGKYRFDNLFSGEGYFFLWSKKDGYGPETIQPIKLAPGESKALPDLKIMLADGVIEGDVVDHEGKPAPGLQVSSQVSGSEPVITDDKGHFRLANVPRGKRYIVVFRDRRSAGGQAAQTGETNVQIKLNPPVKLEAGVVFQDRAGQKAPPVQIQQWLTAAKVDLTALKGKVVLIDFWAIWCKPCIEGLPHVNDLAKQYSAKGLVVIGIHAPGTPIDKILAFLKDKSLTYANALDSSKDSTFGATHKAYGPKGIPHMVLIDQNGQIIVDTNEPDDVDKGLRKLLGD